jgi:hypothetical protein
LNLGVSTVLPLELTEGKAPLTFTSNTAKQNRKNIHASEQFSLHFIRVHDTWELGKASNRVQWFDGSTNSGIAARVRLGREFGFYQAEGPAFSGTRHPRCPVIRPIPLRRPPVLTLLVADVLDAT